MAITIQRSHETAKISHNMKIRTHRLKDKPLCLFQEKNEHRNRKPGTEGHQFQHEIFSLKAYS